MPDAGVGYVRTVRACKPVSQRISARARVCVCVRACVHACACVRVCMCVYYYLAFAA